MLVAIRAPKGERIEPMSRSRYHFVESNRPHFLTCTVVEWLPVFTRQAAVQILLDSWRYLQREDDLRLYGRLMIIAMLLNDPAAVEKRIAQLRGQA